MFQIVSTTESGTNSQNQEGNKEKTKLPDESKDKSFSYKANTIDDDKIPKNMLKDFIDLSFMSNCENMGSVDLYY